MKNHGRIGCLVSMVVSFSAGSAFAETIEDVKKKIHEKVSGYKSLQYKLRTSGETTTNGMSMKNKIDMTVEFQKKGDSWVSRTETRSQTEQGIGDRTMKMETHSLSVEDGEYSYVYMDASGQKNAVKQKLDPKARSNPFNPMAGFKMMEESFNLKLLPDATVEGKPAYVVESTPKDETMKAYVAKTLSYYDKKTCIMLKAANYDAKGTVVSTTTTSDVKIDEKISPDRFVFKAPEGVELLDMTNMGQGTP